MTFYVYTLTDPRCCSVFYVGKGKGKRAYQHTTYERAGKARYNPRKSQRIADILACGLEPTVTIVERYDIEQDAIDHEAELIATMEGLTNILSSGWCSALTKEEAERRLVARQARKSKAALRQWLAWVKTWPNGGTFPGLRNGDALADEFIAIVEKMVAEPAPNF